MKKFEKLTACGGALLFVAACQTAGGLTVIESEPAGALVTVEGYGECDTPCSIEHDDVRNITVAKAGFTPQRFRIAPGAGKVKVQLELAAPTEGVEAEALPELD